MSEEQKSANQLTKTKMIRATLSGDDFINYHSVNGRVIFDKQASERENDEQLTKIAFRLLREKVQERLNSGEVFIEANTL